MMACRFGGAARGGGVALVMGLVACGPPVPPVPLGTDTIAVTTGDDSVLQPTTGELPIPVTSSTGEGATTADATEAGTTEGVDTTAGTTEAGSTSGTMDATDGSSSGGPGDDCHPILVEVFYDLVGGDDQLEWVRLYNPCAAPIDLSGYTLGWGGSDYTYGTLPLSGSIAIGGCFTVGGPMSVAGNGNPILDQAVDLEPDVQNRGTAGDGVALFLGPVAVGGAPVDAVIYGDDNSSGLLDAEGMVSPPHVADAPEGSTIHRTSTAATWAIGAAMALTCPPF